jgi:hypothetical protein
MVLVSEAGEHSGEVVAEFEAAGVLGIADELEFAGDVEDCGDLIG